MTRRARTLLQERAPTSVVNDPASGSGAGTRLEGLRWLMLLVALLTVASIGVPVALLVPDSGPLVWFALGSVAANGPHSPILPVAFEPLIIEAAKHAPVLWVTLVGTGVYMFMEGLNCLLYAWVLHHRRLAGLRERSWIRRSVGWFARAPFLTVVVFAFTPLPFWAARVLALLHGYPMPRFFAATALGRLPRIGLYALLGASVQVPGLLLLAAAAGATLLLVLLRHARGEKILHETVLDTAASLPEASTASSSTSTQQKGDGPTA